MFERFTERARQVVVLAKDEAAKGGRVEIGTDDILLGLIREEDGTAARLLKKYVTYDKVAERIGSLYETFVEDHPKNVRGEFTYTNKAKKVFEYSLREALAMGHNYIGTEHILLALVREPNIASTILESFDVRQQDIRQDLQQLSLNRTEYKKNVNKNEIIDQI